LSFLRFLDTNILIYAARHDPAELVKRDRARELLATQNNVLSVQVLQEFYVQATRPSHPSPMSHSAAVEIIKTWQRFKVQDLTVAVLNDALRIKDRHQLSYWDAAIVAAASAAGCDTLLSEDLSHDQTIEGVRILNPFL
jgi:predicted nucleic acid-binding protein